MIARFYFVVLGLMLSAGPCLAESTVTPYPADVALHGPNARQAVIAVERTAEGVERDVSADIRWMSADPAIAQISGRTVRPVKDGRTTLRGTLGDRTLELPVLVEGMSRSHSTSFVRDIEPILTKMACNSGGCHGAQHGRGGFRLSLFGFDPLFDYSQIVQSSEGRRVVLTKPDESILLQKPTLLMEHGGGEKLKLKGPEYATLLRWLEEGAAEPEANPPHVTALEAYPPVRRVTDGATQQLSVRAVWSDGKKSDVTALTQFDALNEGVAAVNADGLVTAKGKGEGHVMMRFGGQATIMRVSQPFQRIADYPKLPTHNFIDELLIARWKELGVTPSPLTADAEFLRRLYLDAIGTLPTPDEVRKFTADGAPDKRSRAIDAVLNRNEFVDFWALKWGDLLRINRAALNEKGMWSFHNWVRGSLRDNKPIDEFVRDIVTAEGSTFTEGPANYFRVGRSPDDWAETTSQVFLGIRVQCAKCHHHPFEKWSQDDYYGMTAFFTRLGTKNSQEFGLFGQESVIFLRNTGEATHPRKRSIVKPRPFDGEVMEDEFDRRRKLADWMTRPNNPFFARNIANRFWGYLMGRGLVEPLDDMRATNPAVNPELLDRLAQELVKGKYDLKHLLRAIFNSRAWQLTSQVVEGNKADSGNTLFSRYNVKRLSAEQMADAIDFATGTREKYVGLPLGTRAIQLPDSAVRSYLMDVFGRPARQIVCECERTAAPNIAQALHLLNGDFLNRKIADGKGRIESALTSKTDSRKIIDDLFLATLSRLPEADEVKKVEGWVAKAPSPREGLQDLLWTLLNSREFLFNH